jgi:DNA-binding response OmpR family regulator
VGGEPFQLAALDFGPDSVDGWLNRIAAAELGESDQPFLDERDRSVDLGGSRAQLSPLEFGVLSTLAAHPGAPVSRADLLLEVWDTSYDGGSNTVDVVIRSLRSKLGPVADRIETVRGVGYRLK